MGIETWTEDFEWTVARFGASVSFREATRLAWDCMRVSLSETTVRNKTHELAARYQGAPEEAAPPRVDFSTLPECERTVTSSLDGVTVRTTDRDEQGQLAFRELAIARVYTPGRDAVDASTASLTTAHEAGHDLRRLVEQSGSLPPVSDDVVRPDLVGICDGGAGYQNILSRSFPLSALILDLWHLLQHIHELAVALHPGPSPEAQRAQRRFVRTFRAIVKRRGGVAALAWLDKQEPPEDTPAHACFVAQRRYLSANLAHTDYPIYRRRGWPLGSGPVESSCKSLVTLRLKGPGMTWRPSNAARLANLRALFADDRLPCPTDAALAVRVSAA